MTILRAALASGLLLASAGGARASGTQSVQCTGNPAADGAALVKAFHDINLANGGLIVLAQDCVYQLVAPAPVEDLGFWFGPTGLPVVTSTIVVEGNGSTIRRDATASPFRLIAVAGPAGQIPGSSPVYPRAGNLTLRDLTLQGGIARGGAGGASATVGGGGGAGLGGGILVQGALTLDAVTIRDCDAVGGDGGGPLAGAGPGAGGGLGGDGRDGGGGFFGDGALAGGGAVTDAVGATPGDAIIATPPWGVGMPANGRGGDATGIDGGFGGGGGVATDLVGGNGGVGGGGGACIAPGPCNGGHGGFGGGGGAGTPSLFTTAGGVSAFGGGNGAPNSSLNPGFGGGGAGLGVTGKPGYGGGGAGFGGAIFVHGGTVTARNVTLTGNRAIGGAAGGIDVVEANADGSTGGAAGGAAVFVLNGTLTLTSSTIADNHVLGGRSDPTVPGTSAASGGVGALHLDGEATTAGAPTMVMLSNSILSGTRENGAAVNDCRAIGGAMVVSGGHNLVDDAADCTLAGTGDLTGVAPTLSPIADNGGPVQTIAVTGQAATAGACTDLVDARGVPRVAPCAIGAYQPGGYPLAVTVEGTGTVTSAPAGIDCGATCTATIDPLAVPQTYTFTATPGAGARFAGWGGACGGSFPTCTVTVRGPTTVRALFFVPSPDAGVGAGGDAGLPPIGGGSNGCCDVRGSDNRASLVLLLAVAVGLRRRRRSI